jgi:thiol-disulfide isomerase/thioredoxin
MEERGTKHHLRVFFTKAKPWLFYIGLFLVLRYTGILSAVSAVTQSALMQTGMLNASTDSSVDASKKFDYNFQLRDVDGNPVDGSSLKGKTLFINLWATWCGPCRVEMPSIQNLYNKSDKDKVAFIMLALDQNDPFTKVKNYVRDKEFTFPVYFPASELPSLLQVRSIPTTFIVNSSGNVVLKETGTTNFDTEAFRKFLHEQ